MLVDFDDPFMGENGQITIDLSDILEDHKETDGDWYFEITYRGHSDIKKKIEAQTYSVKYKTGGKEAITFPPYSIDEKPSKGLGCVKILSAVTPGGSDVTYLSKQYAGLKYNFYSDCLDERFRDHMNICATVKMSKNETYEVGKKE